MGSKEGERVRVSETIDEWALANRRNTKKAPRSKKPAHSQRLINENLLLKAQ
jgi:hypothetical protein